MLLPDSSFETHYSIAELSKLWKISRESIRLLIKDEPGVFRLSLGKKKSMVRYSVPESVARRIHTRMTSPDVMQRSA